MATTPANGAEHSTITVVEPTVHADAGGGGEVQQRDSSEEQQREGRCAAMVSKLTKKLFGDPSESSAAMARRKVNRLNMIVFCVAFLEWAGNTIGTVAFGWATVVLLGGFCSLLSRTDFWFSAIMIFMEGSRVFIRNDASLKQRLFGSTTAFRWESLSSPDALSLRAAKKLAVLTGVGISFTPIEPRPEIVAGILKMALMVTFSQLQTRGIYAKIVLLLVASAVLCGGIVGALKLGVHYIKRSKANHIVSFLKIGGISLGWLAGVGLVARLVQKLESRIPSVMRDPVPNLFIKAIIASGLACLPFLQAILPSYYRYFSIPIAIVLQSFDTVTMECPDSEQTVSTVRGLLLHILETILPILYIWSMMYPLPGISLKLSFYMLFSVVAGAMFANLQIPVAFLQVLLSLMRLHSLLGRHHHDYLPLPQDASPNLVPSILVFYVMELCQGSFYILATILGLISIFCRIWLVRDLKFQKEWGANAVNLYHRLAYHACTQEGRFPSEESTPSLTSFAIQCVDPDDYSTSRETVIVGLRILDTILQQWDPHSKRELTAEITSTSKEAVPILFRMLIRPITAKDKYIRLLAASIIAELTGSIKISEVPETNMVYLICELLDVKNRYDFLLPVDESLRISEFPVLKNLISSLLDPDNQQNGRSQSICTAAESRLLWQMFYPVLGMSILFKLAGDPDNWTEMVEEASCITNNTGALIVRYLSEDTSGDPKQRIPLRLSLNFLRWLASNSWKNGARFRQKLSENFTIRDSLKRILYVQDYQSVLWEPVMDIIGKLALDKDARRNIGRTQVIIDKLMCAFLREDDVNPSENKDHSLQMAAGKALANLTIESTYNCSAILLADPDHNLIKNLIKMLEDEHLICVAANLLHNLCANSRDKLIDLDEKVHLINVLPKVMETILTKEGKQLEDALCVASQIGYVIPRYFAENLESDMDAAAAEQLVKKLLDTLKSNSEPCLVYPRIRRVVVEVVIAIVELCPGYIKIFREKGVKEALDMVKETPSRLEKYRVFLDSEGVVEESLPMRDLVDKAKRLIDTVKQGETT